jgi:hypothetical protein
VGTQYDPVVRQHGEIERRHDRQIQHEQRRRSRAEARSARAAQVSELSTPDDA